MGRREYAASDLTYVAYPSGMSHVDFIAFVMVLLTSLLVTINLYLLYIVLLFLACTARIGFCASINPFLRTQDNSCMLHFPNCN